VGDGKLWSNCPGGVPMRTVKNVKVDGGATRTPKIGKTIRPQVATVVVKVYTATLKTSASSS